MQGIVSGILLVAAFVAVMAAAVLLSVRLLRRHPGTTSPDA